MNNKLPILFSALVLFLASCNNSSNNKVNSATFSSAVNFVDVKTLAYTLIGDTPTNNFVDDVEVDNNKLHFTFNDSIRGKTEYYATTENNIDYLYTNVGGKWNRKEDTGFAKMFKPAYYFTKFNFSDFIYIDGSLRYASNKIYRIDNFNVSNVKLRFENNKLIDAEILLINDDKSINHVMNYTYAYKSISITLPSID